jgi:hypothetical protein
MSAVMRILRKAYLLVALLLVQGAIAQAQIGSVPWPETFAQEDWRHLIRESTIVARATVVKASLQVVQPDKLQLRYVLESDGTSTLVSSETPEYLVGELVRLRLDELFKCKSSWVTEGSIVELYSPWHAALRPPEGIELFVLLDRPIQLDFIDLQKLGGNDWSALVGTTVIDLNNPSYEEPFNPAAAYELARGIGVPSVLPYVSGNPTFLAVLAEIQAGDFYSYLVTPRDDAYVSGDVELSVAAVGRPIDSVQYTVDWEPLGAPVTEAPFKTVWDTLTVTEGRHSIGAVVRDADGNTATTRNVPIHVWNTTAKIQADRAKAAPGEVVQVLVNGASGDPNDWVGLFADLDSDSAFLARRFLNGHETPPALGLRGASLAFAMPASPGSYDFRLFDGGSGVRRATSWSVIVEAPKGPALAVDPVSVDFGAVETGSSAERAVHFTNVGTGQLTGRAWTTTSAFALAGPTEYTLASTRSAQLVVRFTPTAAGPASGSLVLSSGQDVTIPLTGTGIGAGTQGILEK